MDKYRDPVTKDRDDLQWEHLEARVEHTIQSISADAIIEPEPAAPARKRRKATHIAAGIVLLTGVVLAASGMIARRSVSHALDGMGVPDYLRRYATPVFLDATETYGVHDRVDISGAAARDIVQALLFSDRQYVRAVDPSSLPAHPDKFDYGKVVRAAKDPSSMGEVAGDLLKAAKDRMDFSAVTKQDIAAQARYSALLRNAAHAKPSAPILQDRLSADANKLLLVEMPMPSISAWKKIVFWEIGRAAVEIQEQQYADAESTLRHLYSFNRLLLLNEPSILEGLVASFNMQLALKGFVALYTAKGDDALAEIARLRSNLTGITDGMPTPPQGEIWEPGFIRRALRYTVDPDAPIGYRADALRFLQYADACGILPPEMRPGSVGREVWLSALRRSLPTGGDWLADHVFVAEPTDAARLLPPSIRGALRCYKGIID